jgi:hypothetical protein
MYSTNYTCGAGIWFGTKKLGSGAPWCCMNPALVLMYSSPEAALAQLAAALNHSSDSLRGAPKQAQLMSVF